MTIIRTTLEAICRAANRHIAAVTGELEDKVVLTSLVDQDGTANAMARDRIVMSLCHLAPDTSLADGRPSLPFATTAPTLQLTLDIMFIANFSGQTYAAGLAMLSHLLGYFQQTPVLSRSILPDLDPSIEQLHIELMAISSTELSAILALHGGRYLPTACYRLRSLPIRADGALPAPILG